MKTFLKVLLIVVATIIVLVVGIFAYVMIKNPLGLGDIVRGSVLKQGVEENIEKNKNYDHPLLTEEQEETAIQAGVDISQIPTEVTAEQIECGVEKLGQERVDEIKGGSEPTALEIMKLLPCAN